MVQRVQGPRPAPLVPAKPYALQRNQLRPTTPVQHQDSNRKSMISNNTIEIWNSSSPHHRLASNDHDHLEKFSEKHDELASWQSSPPLTPALTAVTDLGPIHEEAENPYVSCDLEQLEKLRWHLEKYNEAAGLRRQLGWVEYDYGRKAPEVAEDRVEIEGRIAGEAQRVCWNRLVYVCRP